MDEKSFWGCTPAKLFSLLEIHNKVNTIDTDEDSKPRQKAEKLSLEEALAWAGKR